MIDLEPATTALAGVVRGVRDDQLSAATPLGSGSLGDLLDHVNGLAFAFAAAATKTVLPEAQQQGSADASGLGTDWRERIPARLTALASAWRDPAAWSGMTHAGAVEVPGEVAAAIAANEVIVHGWDIAVASGQPFHAETELVGLAEGFVQQTVARSPEGTPGLFGPPVPVPAKAPPLDRLLGLTGRDPHWKTGASDG
jgi:uncharacterized protein (TIGR03086 family)